MEKKQVSTFLKILQIPTNAPPAEIKESLLASGWNVKDAEEAIRVLYPTYSPEAGTEPVVVTEQPQLVAQRYVKAPEEEPVAADTDDAETVAEIASTPVSSESIPTPPEPEVTEPTVAKIPVPPPAPKPEAKPESIADTPKQSPVKSEEDFDFASVTKAHAVAAQQAASPAPAPSPAEEAVAEQNRPHTDAPWLKDQVDIYDVSEEEKQEMIRTVYRTNERLTPQTIHALLGIDVDLSEYEAAYHHRKRNEVSGIQVAVILLSSLAIAAIALYLGLYYFEVGPFHPSITGGR